MTKKFFLLFFLILFVGILLRTYKVSEIPPGVNRDEASIGYTAYSILMTGKDEYEKGYPISFQSFGDWKLPLYIYATIPAIKLFGLNEFAVRIISILVGIGSIILTYFLVKELFGKKSLALLTMFLVAVAPWHIHLSRVESEANTAVFFIIAGMLLFLKSFGKYKWLLIASGALFALTYYTYAGNYIFTTLLVGSLIILYRKKLLAHKYVLWSGIIFIILSLLIFSQTVFGANKTKLSGIGIFGDPAIVHAQIEIPRNQHQDQSSFFVRMVHNRVVFAGKRFVQNYLNAFSPDFLFIKGGINKAHNIEGFGNMYLIESLFLLVGFIVLITKKRSAEETILLIWFLIAPFASSITKDAPHTNRMFAIFPALSLVVAIGIQTAWIYIQNFRFKTLFLLCFILLFGINIASYLDQYFVHFPKNETENWGLEYKNLYTILQQKYENKNIIISRPTHSPYIFLLFYSGYNPKLYLQTAKKYPITTDGFVHVAGYDRYEFKDINWQEDIKKPNTIIVANPIEVPDFISADSYKKSSIMLPNGLPMFILIETP